MGYGGAEWNSLKQRYQKNTFYFSLFGTTWGIKKQELDALHPHHEDVTDVDKAGLPTCPATVFHNTS
jgi:hypothetical protein